MSSTDVTSIYINQQHFYICIELIGNQLLGGQEAVKRQHAVGWIMCCSNSHREEQLTAGLMSTYTKIKYVRYHWSSGQRVRQLTTIFHNFKSGSGLERAPPSIVRTE